MGTGGSSKNPELGTGFRANYERTPLATPAT